MKSLQPTTMEVVIEAWQKHGTALNGDPSCHKLVDDSIAELNENFGRMVEQFADLVQKASK